MFTGIVEELGEVRQLLLGTMTIYLTVGARKVLSDVQIGDSIAVNGVCLTVVKHNGKEFTVDIMPETLRKTNLKNLRMGDKVNLERAATLTTRLGGHIVSGHVDGIGVILEKQQERNAVIIKISAPAQLTRYLIPRGSIAVDGISLTVVECGEDFFRVSLIPHTASMTTLGLKQPGESVNLESDVIARYVEKMLSKEADKDEGKKMMQLLGESGFI